jgi:hypothetical protein
MITFPELLQHTRGGSEDGKLSPRAASAQAAIKSQKKRQMLRRNRKKKRKQFVNMSSDLDPVQESNDESDYSTDTDPEKQPLLSGRDDDGAVRTPGFYNPTNDLNEYGDLVQDNSIFG